MSINFKEANSIRGDIQAIIRKLDKIINLYLNPRIYANGDVNIDLTETNMENLEIEYDQLKDELKDKIDELP